MDVECSIYEGDWLNEKSGRDREKSFIFKMDSLIGDFFLKNGQSKAQHIEAVTGEAKLKAVMLYFGGSWAPPCEGV